MAATRSTNLGNLYVPRVVSFLVLLAIILLVGIVFFQVMAQFIVPLFLACVLLVVFQPLHRWYLDKTPRWTRLAALLTTITVLLTVLVPTIFIGWKAYVECAEHIEKFSEKAAVQRKSQQPPATASAAEAPSAAVRPQNGNANAATVVPTDEKTPDIYTRFVTEVSNWVTDKIGITFEPNEIKKFFSDQVGWVANLLPQVAGAAIRIVVGLIIMVIATYYFFADGPAMINGIIRLSPMDERHELELLARFAEISRSVVVATMLSAIVQGLLAGVGFYFALPSGAPIFLLMALTMVFAIVPFVGAAGVWIPTCIIIFFFGEQVFVVGGEAVAGGNWKVAAALAVYCAVVVSGIDNVIKPLVLHGQANLHPLLALLSILGGIQVLGPVGILIGPMLVSFLQALLAMFRRELEQWEDPTQKSLTLSPTAQALAEHIEAAADAAEDGDHNDKPAAAKGAQPAPTKKKGR
jgi:predicted PurR-regulated permease PerM